MRYARPMPPNAPHRGRNAFTLLELILSMTVLTAIMVVLAQVMSGVQRVWRGGSEDAAIARAAFIALDRIAADLSAAAPAPFPDLAAGGEAEPDDSADGARPPILVIRPAPPVLAPLPPEQEKRPEGVPSEEAVPFSRIAVLRRSESPIWGTKDDSALRPLRRPPRADEAEIATLLRGLLRVRYDVVPQSKTTDSEVDEETTSSDVAFTLVRSVAGVAADAADSGSEGDPWWKGDDIPETDFGVSEIVARNVVWFGVSVPDFLGVATNATGAAVGGFHVWGDYATVSGLEASESGAGTLSLPQPLPPLVDVVIGLVSDQTLSRASAQRNDPERRKAILRDGVHVYSRRIQIR